MRSNSNAMKTIKSIAMCVIVALTLNSCATVFGGHVSDAQRTKPKAGEQARKVRTVALVADIVLCPIICLPVDFLTCAIYRPEQKK